MNKQEKKMQPHPLLHTAGQPPSCAPRLAEIYTLTLRLSRGLLRGINTRSDPTAISQQGRNAEEFLLQQCLNGTSFFVPLFAQLVYIPREAFHTWTLLKKTKSPLSYFCTVLLRKSTRNASQNGVPSASELPPRLRGCNQPDGQHGAVCLLHLHFYGEKQHSEYCF